MYDFVQWHYHPWHSYVHIDNRNTRRPQRVAPDTVRYFKQIGRLLTSEDQDENDGPRPEQILENIASEIDGNEASLCSDCDCSFVMERVVEQMKGEQICGFVANLTEFFPHLFTNRYGSHVMETLLRRIALLLERCSSEEVVGAAPEEFVVHVACVVYS